MWTILDYLPQIYILLSSLLISDVYSQGCPVGWFGEQCNFLCHCSKSSTCDVATGQCPGTETCQKGFFGTACQFVDLVYTEGNKSNEAYLMDGDDTTCNPDTSASTVVVYVKRAYPLSFIRIFATNGIGVEFKLTLNVNEECSRQRSYNISKTTVDVTCDRAININSVTIEGLVAPYVCSVYISGGRNVALKQKVSQAGVTTVLQYGEPENAVDGYTNSNFDDHHCFSTDVQTTPPVWFMTYDNAYVIYSIRIYNRDILQYRLMAFYLVTFTNNAAIGMLLTAPNVTLPIYDVIHTSRDALASVKIQQSPQHNGTDKVLTMCEVETYGDIVCPANTYGLTCEENCSCTLSQFCHPATGACGEACPPNSYGQNCTRQCNSNCLNMICAYLTGLCIQCNPGYKGTYCDQVCLAGTYGIGCMSNCSENCVTLCDFVNGSCTCKPNYLAPLCLECQRGYYGSDCLKLCMPLCLQCEKDTGDCVVCQGNLAGRSCDECKMGYFDANCSTPCPPLCLACEKTTGDCITCDGHYAGRLCKGCQPKLYGPKCDQNCSVRCLNSECDSSTGKCHSCEDGFNGDFCENETSYLWLLLILLAAMLLLMCICMLKWIREKKAAEIKPAPTEPAEPVQPEEKEVPVVPAEPPEEISKEPRSSTSIW